MTVTACSPQRYLANNRNLFAGAIITPSSVLPVANKVLPLPFARTGTARAILSGLYTGAEQADYEIQIVDTDIEIARVSVPTFSGEGSGRITDIAAAGVAQTFDVACTDAGIEAQQAAVPLEGVIIRALAEGTSGNSIRMTVDESALVFTDTDRTTLSDLTAGQGGTTSPFFGAGFDWGQATLDANGLIPVGAPRIAFKGDKSNIYLPYRKWVDDAWQYFTVPALRADVPKGTIVQTVTGGRTVMITDGSLVETQTDIVTVYDLLIWIATNSELVYVDGVYANDRSPTGQASRELSLRTDAHAEASTGSGSSYARGLINVSVDDDAGTQRVVFTCFAATAADHPNARLGGELWQVESSLTGVLGIVKTGVPFTFDDFSGTVPTRLPPGYGQDKGAIGGRIDYVTRGEEETEPPVCFAGMRLGSEATDKTVRFKYSPEPSGDCDCSAMPGPNLNLSCLGVPSEGGGSVSYKDDTNTKLTAMRAWYKEMSRELSEYFTFGGFVNAQDNAALTRPIEGTGNTLYAEQTESLLTIMNNFEATIAQIDLLEEASPPGYREAGMLAWDDAFAELQSDFETAIGGASPSYEILSIPSVRYDASLAWALASAGIANVGKSDASTVSGDGCWRDWGGPRWEDMEGVYAPLFSNHPFYFARRAVGGGYISTHEAGGQINVKCPEDLKYGDIITITINGAGHGVTYQVEDELVLNIVAASALYLNGGVTGAPIQEWSVGGSVTGAMTPYTFNPDSPTAYSFSAGGVDLSFLLVEGGIPFAKGDRFRFAVEGGHLRWRKNGGAWDDTSPPIPIPLDTFTLDEGLELSFAAGAAASFVTGDVYKFRALQPWAASNAQSPTPAVYKWDGDTASYEADFGSVQQIDVIALLCDLPDGATVEFSGGVLDATDWTEELTVRDGCIWAVVDHQARYASIDFADAPAGALQWAFAGVPVSTSLSGYLQLRKGFKMNRPGNGLQGGRYVGKAVHGSIEWTESALTEADVDGLAEMIDYVKEHDDEPIIVIPQVSRDDDTFAAPLLAFIASDDIDFPDQKAYNQQKGIPRRVSATLPLEGVWQ